MKHGHTVENYAQVVRDVYKLSKIQQMNYKGDEEQRSSQVGGSTRVKKQENGATAEGHTLMCRPIFLCLDTQRKCLEGHKGILN